MTSRFSIALAAPLLVSGLALAGCKTEAQKEVDQQAEAIDDSFEAEADLREAIAAGAPNAVQAQVRNQADALRAQGEKTKDHLENMAKELKDVPRN